MCLKHNPANYTTWHFRRQILATLLMESTSRKDTIAYNLDRVKEDLALTSEMGGENPKNYQIWYHRQSLLENLITNDDEGIECAKDELTYTASVFEEDSKNYHVSWRFKQTPLLSLFLYGSIYIIQVLY